MRSSDFLPQLHELWPGERVRPPCLEAQRFMESQAVLDRSRQRLTLALTVLPLPAEEHMHANRMHELIKRRGKDSVVSVAWRKSVYQTIAGLLRIGLIRVRETPDAAAGSQASYENSLCSA